MKKQTKAKLKEFFKSALIVLTCPLWLPVVLIIVLAGGAWDKVLSPILRVFISLYNSARSMLPKYDCFVQGHKWTHDEAVDHWYCDKCDTPDKLYDPRKIAL